MCQGEEESHRYFGKEEGLLDANTIDGFIRYLSRIFCFIGAVDGTIWLLSSFFTSFSSTHKPILLLYLLLLYFGKGATTRGSRYPRRR